MKIPVCLVSLCVCVVAFSDITHCKNGGSADGALRLEGKCAKPENCPWRCLYPVLHECQILLVGTVTQHLSKAPAAMLGGSKNGVHRAVRQQGRASLFHKVTGVSSSLKSGTQLLQRAGRHCGGRCQQPSQTDQE